MLRRSLHRLLAKRLLLDIVQHLCNEKANVKITLAARQQVKKSEQLSLFVQFCQVKADSGMGFHLDAKVYAKLQNQRDHTINP